MLSTNGKFVWKIVECWVCMELLFCCWFHNGIYFSFFDFSFPSGNLRENHNHIYQTLLWKLMPWFWHVWLRISPSCLANPAAHAKIFFDFFITRVFLQNAWWSILFHAGAILNKSRAEKSPTSLLLWQTHTKNARVESSDIAVRRGLIAAKLQK